MCSNRNSTGRRSFWSKILSVRIYLSLDRFKLPWLREKVFIELFRIFNIINIVGASLSSIALLIATVILLMLRKIRSTRNFIHCNLFMSIIVSTVFKTMLFIQGKYIFLAKVMLVTALIYKTFGDSFKMLVAESLCWWLFNVKNRSPSFPFGHQHLKVVITINRLQHPSPTSFIQDMVLLTP